jgi:hypothetical protein
MAGRVRAVLGMDPEPGVPALRGLLGANGSGPPSAGTINSASPVHVAIIIGRVR